MAESKTIEAGQRGEADDVCWLHLAMRVKLENHPTVPFRHAAKRATRITNSTGRKLYATAELLVLSACGAWRVVAGVEFETAKYSSAATALEDLFVVTSLSVILPDGNLHMKDCW